MIYVMTGRILLRNNRLFEAESMFRKTLDVDPDNAHAWVGMGETYLRLNRHEMAADAALSALALLYRLEQAHWILGVAMLRMKQLPRAKQAFQTLLKFKSSRYEVAARRQLQKISLLQGQTAEAERQGQQARQKLARRRAQKLADQQRKEELLELPTIPAIPDRIQALQLERPRSQDKARQSERQCSGRTLTIVSGLPRSGTSLMMQMLAAGGLPAQTDGQRTADDDNPQGYLEWEAVKRLHKHPELFDDESLDGKAIKVISMLLTGLPSQHRYRLIFMSRPAIEIAASQRKMIERLETEGASGDLDAIAEKLARHREQSLQWLRSQAAIDLLVVEYPNLIARPETEARRVAEFLGPDLIQHPARMASVIQPDLYRQKRSVVDTEVR